MISRISLTAGGILNLLFGLFHLTFPWLLRWTDDLGGMSAGNKAVLFTAHVWIIFVLLAFAYLSVFHCRQLLTTALGTSLLTVIFFLWIIRAGAEVVFFRLGEEGALWRVFLFVALATLYLLPVLRRDAMRGGGDDQ